MLEVRKLEVGDRQHMQNLAKRVFLSYGLDYLEDNSVCDVLREIGMRIDELKRYIEQSPGLPSCING